MSLHFAEVAFREPGHRSFSVLLQRKRVLERYEPLGAGFGTAEAKTFETRVDLGFLDLDFLAESDEPVISALEIEMKESSP